MLLPSAQGLTDHDLLGEFIDYNASNKLVAYTDMSTGKNWTHPL